MRWSLRTAANYNTPTKLMELSVKELQQLDRFLTDVAQKRLAHTQKQGMSPAEYSLKQAGVLTDNMRAIDSTDKQDLIIRTQALGNFARAKTSTLQGFKRSIRLKEIRTKQHNIPLKVQDVIDKLKQRGLWNKVAANYHDSATILETIEEIINEVEDEKDILQDTTEEFWRRFEEATGINMGTLVDPTKPLNQRPEEEFFKFNIGEDDEDDADTLIDNIWRGL